MNKIKSNKGTFLSGPMVKTPHYQFQGPGFQSLARELDATCQQLKDTVCCTKDSTRLNQDMARMLSLSLTPGSLRPHGL